MNRGPGGCVPWEEYVEAVQSAEQLAIAVEGWLWFDSAVEHPEDHYSRLKAYETAKATITGRVAKGVARYRTARGEAR